MGHYPCHNMMKQILFLVLGLVLINYLGMVITTNTLNDNLKVAPEWASLSFCKLVDETPPEIILSGETMVAVKVGEEYLEPSVTVVDDCDEVVLEKDGEVDVNVVGTYEITYRATDTSSNTTEVTRTVNVIPEYRGTIYLTFDDGPGDYTAELLDILAKYNVKATFFVTGYGDDSLIVREYDEGHAIGLHTASHNYSYIYQNVDTFFEDLYRVQERVKNLTGYTSYLMRFPGGSSNTVSRRYDGGARIMTQLSTEVVARGFTYFDWNISSGDAGNVDTPDAVFENVVYAFKEGGASVVLQHDVKSFSVAAVERIIQFGLANGYKFDKLDASSFTAHHRINN